MAKASQKFGTAPVFFTAISTILGAILFLRFGYATGMVGFLGVIFIILLGHLVTIPTALAISEIATNQRVEGGGEYFIISRSFGLNIGATIGIALYLSQAISVAFYVIAFTEAFTPFFDFMLRQYDILLPRQVISIPAMIGLAVLILTKGASLGVKTLYVVVVILILSLVLFFLGKPVNMNEIDVNLLDTRNLKSDFFVVFAICFPAFTGMTAGVGLSGDLKNPSKSIPLGTTLATAIGMIVYGFIAYKLAISARPTDLVSNQLIMSEIAIMGSLIIPLGLAASTISSAIGSVLVAPRTLQALGSDDTIPIIGLNKFFAKEKGANKEPYNATIITCILALVFVIMGDVNAVAEIISMFFMVTYGALCLISFLYHFGADPSYRPAFRSRWYISLVGFVMCVWLMFKINTVYAVAAIVLMVLLYILISFLHKDRRGMQDIFQSALFQIGRNIQISVQRNKNFEKGKWRPAAICISEKTFENHKPLQLLKWISDKHGFGTYIHLIEGYFSSENNKKANDILEKLIKIADDDNKVYLDTLISPSYTSAIAQMIQLPGVAGMENNLVIFDFDKEHPEQVGEIAENLTLTKAANMDIAVFGVSHRTIHHKNGIHVWIKSTDFDNSNLMILLSYIILGHKDWKKGAIKIFEISPENEVDNKRQQLLEIIKTGRLPISPNNIEIIKLEENISAKTLINEKSADAGLTVIGFREEQLKKNSEVFTGYDNIGDVLFINSRTQKEI
jgi:amino acid transporter